MLQTSPDTPPFELTLKKGETYTQLQQSAPERTKTDMTSSNRVL